MKINRSVFILLVLIAALMYTGCSNGGNGLKSKEWKNAMDTYKKYLSKASEAWVDVDFAMDETMKFMTKDINEDGTPELFLLAPYRDVCCCRSFTVVSDGMIEITGFDEFNSYYPGTGVFSYKNYENDHTFDQGGITAFFYMDDASKYSVQDTYLGSLRVGGIKNAFPKINRAAEYYWGGIRIKGKEKEYYEKFNESIPENEFYSNLRELIGDTEAESVTEEWIPNTEENRDKYLK